ncbi:MAG TPA: ATP-binding cassette domain-containing protein [Isosphaeraceae bacterium]|nr:ATP-binding cassette domain-containing protein [Isosphaeraceae bacterium]
MSQGSARDGARGDDLIALRRVSMRFRHQAVLRDIELTIRRGETVSIIGESGCGKTVMLKLIIGLLQPSQGTVQFDGRDIAGLNGKELVQMRLRFGFLFQMAALFDSLTVFDNVAFGLREHRFCDEDAIQRIVAERLQEVGLPTELAAKKPAELSGGQRKRVGLARALAIGPEVMLYDEPTTGLDPIMSDVINELILQTQRTKKTTGVVVTHDMKTVTKVADRVVMLYPLARLGEHEAQIIYDGPPEGLETAEDPRVGQFVRGEAGERLREMAQLRHNNGAAVPAVRAAQCLDQKREIGHE